MHKKNRLVFFISYSTTHLFAADAAAFSSFYLFNKAVNTQTVDISRSVWIAKVPFAFTLKRSSNHNQLLHNKAKETFAIQTLRGSFGSFCYSCISDEVAKTPNDKVPLLNVISKKSSQCVYFTL